MSFFYMALFVVHPLLIVYTNYYLHIQVSRFKLNFNPVSVNFFPPTKKAKKKKA